MMRPFEVMLSAVVALLLAVAVVLLSGCQPHWQLCEVDTWDHPSKPAPAREARVRCSRTVMCDQYAGGKCDGKNLAEVGK